MSIVNVEALKQNGCELWWTGSYGAANAPKAITSNGNVTQVLPFPGAGIGMFDGTGDYLTTPNHVDFTPVHAGTYTWEMNVYFNSFSTSFNSFFYHHQDAGNQLHFRTKANGSGLYLYMYVGGVEKSLANITMTLSTNTWYHIVLVKNGTNYKSYVNGELKTDSTQTTEIPNLTGVLSLGCYYWDIGKGYDLNGNISEVRLSDVARYTANFTPPKRQLESDEHTKLLLHFNRNDSTFIDSSPSAHAITAYGDAKQLCSPCGSGVAYFDGSGDYLTIPDNASLELGANNFTIEFWFNTLTYGPPDQWGNKGCIISRNQGIAEYGTWTIILDNGSGKIVGYCRDCSDRWINTSISSYHNDGTWHHLAWVRNGTSWMLFIDGILESTATYSVTVTDLNQPISIGKDLYFNRDFNGYLSNLRISIGVARYTADFIPQTTPFKPDPYTKLLLHMDGVGNAFYDSSDPPGDNGFPILPDGVTVTPNGTFTTQKMKDGRNIWAFNGSNNYITFGANNNLTYFGTNDFTLCAWVYSTAFNSKYMRIFGIADYSASNIWWCLGVGSHPAWGSNAINIAVTNGNNSYLDTSAANVLTNGAWNHVILVVRNGSIEFYCNAVRCPITTSNMPANWSYNAVSSLYIGNSRSNVSELMDGCIKDAMIFKKALTQDQIAAIMKETYIY
jgi:hypothetical protein